MIQQLEGVHRLEKANEEKLDVYCNKDITAKIAEAIIQHGANLYSINRKNYGLDEIYHRYFEGRDVHETS